MLTLGFDSPHGLSRQLLAFASAGVGLTLLALVITYIPTLYGAFRRRGAGLLSLPAVLEPLGAGDGGGARWAALLITVCDVPRRSRSELCLDAGCRALLSIAEFLAIPHHPPEPDEEIALSEEQFDAARRELA